MAIIKNPFRKQDENVRPNTLAPQRSSETTESIGAKSLDSDAAKEPAEYKLSEVNDSGVFLPPSPTEKKSFWGGTTASRSTTSSSLHRCAFNENEPFSISRESFDSYRRSFDISAKSPVIQPQEGRPPRASLDSRTFQTPPRSSASYQRGLQVPQTQEEDKFEDVNIDDPKPHPAKKRGLFARMADSVPGVGNDSERPTSQDKSSSWHHFGARKRGQSGVGAELGSMPKRDETPKPEKQQQKQQPTTQEVVTPEALQPIAAHTPEVKVDS